MNQKKNSLNIGSFFYNKCLKISKKYVKKNCTIKNLKTKKIKIFNQIFCQISLVLSLLPMSFCSLSSLFEIVLYPYSFIIVPLGVFLIVRQTNIPVIPIKTPGINNKRINTKNKLK